MCAKLLHKFQTAKFVHRWSGRLMHFAGWTLWKEVNKINRIEDQPPVRHPSLRTMCWPHIPWLNTLKTAKTAGYINKLWNLTSTKEHTLIVWVQINTVKTRIEEPSGLRTSWQKFATLLPQNTRTRSSRFLCELQLNYDKQ